MASAQRSRGCGMGAAQGGGWCVGSEEFKRNLPEKIDEDLGGNHSGELRRERAEVKADRIISEELQRLGWNRKELALRPKGDPAKLAIGNRLRLETVLPVAAIATKLHLGSPKSARARLRELKGKTLKRRAALSTLTIRKLNSKMWQCSSPLYLIPEFLREEKSLDIRKGTALLAYARKGPINHEPGNRRPSFGADR